MIIVIFFILWEGCSNFWIVFIMFNVFLLKKSIVVIIVLKKYFVWFFLNWCNVFCLWEVCLFLKSNNIWLL